MKENYLKKIVCVLFLCICFYIFGRFFVVGFLGGGVGRSGIFRGAGVVA